jgi:uncharacterized protein (DUF885 family)
MLGDHRWDDRIEDLSRETEDLLIERFDGFAAGAEAIDPTGLGRTDRITRRSLIFEATSHADRLRNRTQEFEVDPMLGIHLFLVNYIPQLTPQTAEQAEALVVKASQVDRLFDQAIERLRHGVATGRTPPAIHVEKSLQQMDAYLAGPASNDGFLRIAPPPDMGEEAVAAWRTAMSEQVEGSVRPGLAAYRAFVASEVMPAARPEDRAGLCWLPGGDEIYARAARSFTSLDLDPAEVHRWGLEEITGLEDEYRQMASELLGTSDIAEIYDRLRHDPQLRFGTAEEVKAAAQEALDRANAASPQWFGRLPETPCILQEVPEVGAEDQPIAFYMPPANDGTRPGIFFVNTTEPTTRTRYESEALAFHESVPGHHFQIAIAQELNDIPLFRRNATSTAYVEGWGLYVERLADEMGLYGSPIARLGMLSFDSWRAGRLVVDTGLHALGWSRSQAIDYLIENSPQAPNNVANEVDRYLGYAGQALAYKVGQREILRLRRRAEARLGDAFDIRTFHDRMLGDGALPLELLADTMDEWMEGISR